MADVEPIAGYGRKMVASYDHCRRVVLRSQLSNGESLVHSLFDVLGKAPRTNKNLVPLHEPDSAGGVTDSDIVCWSHCPFAGKAGTFSTPGLNTYPTLGELSNLDAIKRLLTPLYGLTENGVSLYTNEVCYDQATSFFTSRPEKRPLIEVSLGVSLMYERESTVMHKFKYNTDNKFGKVCTTGTLVGKVIWLLAGRVKPSVNSQTRVDFPATSTGFTFLCSDDDTMKNTVTLCHIVVSARSVIATRTQFSTAPKALCLHKHDEFVQTTDGDGGSRCILKTNNPFYELNVAAIRKGDAVLVDYADAGGTVESRMDTVRNSLIATGKRHDCNAAAIYSGPAAPVVRKSFFQAVKLEDNPMAAAGMEIRRFLNDQVRHDLTVYVLKNYVFIMTIRVMHECGLFGNKVAFPNWNDPTSRERLVAVLGNPTLFETGLDSTRHVKNDQISKFVESTAPDNLTKTLKDLMKQVFTWWHTKFITWPFDSGKSSCIDGEQSEYQLRGLQYMATVLTLEYMAFEDQEAMQDQEPFWMGPLEQAFADKYCQRDANGLIGAGLLQVAADIVNTACSTDEAQLKINNSIDGHIFKITEFDKTPVKIDDFIKISKAYTTEAMALVVPVSVADIAQTVDMAPFEDVFTGFTAMLNGIMPYTIVTKPKGWRVAPLNPADTRCQLVLRWPSRWVQVALAHNDPRKEKFKYLDLKLENLDPNYAVKEKIRELANKKEAAEPMQVDGATYVDADVNKKFVEKLKQYSMAVHDVEECIWRAVFDREQKSYGDSSIDPGAEYTVSEWNPKIRTAYGSALKTAEAIEADLKVIFVLLKEDAFSSTSTKLWMLELGGQKRYAGPRRGSNGEELSREWTRFVLKHADDSEMHYWHEEMQAVGRNDYNTGTRRHYGFSGFVADFTNPPPPQRDIPASVYEDSRTKNWQLQISGGYCQGDAGKQFVHRKSFWYNASRNNDRTLKTKFVGEGPPSGRSIDCCVGGSFYYAGFPARSDKGVYIKEDRYYTFYKLPTVHEPGKYESNNQTAETALNLVGSMQRGQMVPPEMKDEWTKVAQTHTEAYADYTIYPGNMATYYGRVTILLGNTGLNDAIYGNPTKAADFRTHWFLNTKLNSDDWFDQLAFCARIWWRTTDAMDRQQYDDAVLTMQRTDKSVKLDPTQVQAAAFLTDHWIAVLLEMERPLQTYMVTHKDDGPSWILKHVHRQIAALQYQSKLLKLDTFDVIPVHIKAKNVDATEDINGYTLLKPIQGGDLDAFKGIATWYLTPFYNQQQAGAVIMYCIRLEMTHDPRLLQRYSDARQRVIEYPSEQIKAMTPAQRSSTDTRNETAAFQILSIEKEAFELLMSYYAGRSSMHRRMVYDDSLITTAKDVIVVKQMLENQKLLRSKVGDLQVGDTHTVKLLGIELLRPYTKEEINDARRTEGVYMKANGKNSWDKFWFLMHADDADKYKVVAFYTYRFINKLKDPDEYRNYIDALGAANGQFTAEADHQIESALDIWARALEELKQTANTRQNTTFDTVFAKTKELIDTQSTQLVHARTLSSERTPLQVPAPRANGEPYASLQSTFRKADFEDMSDSVGSRKRQPDDTGDFPGLPGQGAAKPPVPVFAGSGTAQKQQSRKPTKLPGNAAAIDLSAFPQASGATSEAGNTFTLPDPATEPAANPRANIDPATIHAATTPAPPGLAWDDTNPKRPTPDTIDASDPTGSVTPRRKPSAAAKPADDDAAMASEPVVAGKKAGRKPKADSKGKKGGPGGASMTAELQADIAGYFSD